MILESIVTSVDVDGKVNVAPMGPIVDRALTQFELRPFASSTTYANLQQTSRCVIHVSDDVLLIARAAIGKLGTVPAMRQIDGGWWVLEEASRWFAVEAQQWSDDVQRASVRCKICSQGTGPPMFGMNRAKFAVLEAAILATRVHLLPIEQIQSDLQRLLIPVQKTGGDQEHQAFELLQRYVDEHSASIG